MLHRKNPDHIGQNGYTLLTCEIITKNFVTKRGQKTERIEYFLRRSIQDYFIKFSESDISQLEIEQHLKLVQNDFIKMITVEVEFKKGPWDDCVDGEEMESRMGEYVVLKKLKK